MSNFVAEFMIVYETMTLRELLQSVDAEAYASIPLYEKLLKTKPEYGSSNRIKVQETDILCAYYGLQTKRLSTKKIAEKHSLTESRVLRMVRESERKLQFSDEAISIWKYLYRK